MSHLEIFVETSPDRELALRILREHRRHFSVHYQTSTTGFWETDREQLNYLNDLQDKRVRELDRVISILEAALSRPSSND